MNFNDAIATHIKWRVRLMQFMAGAGFVIESDTARNDTLCDLGLWLYGKGAEYRSLRAYRNLVDKHAEFHVCAAEVVRLVQAGDKAGAQVLLTAAFARVSDEMIAAIMALHKEVAVPGFRTESECGSSSMDSR